MDQRNERSGKLSDTRPKDMLTIEQEYPMICTGMTRVSVSVTECEERPAKAGPDLTRISHSHCQ